MPAKKPEPAEVIEQQQEPTQIVRVIEPYVTLPSPPTREEMVKQAEDQIFVFKQYMKLFSQEVRPEQVLLFGENIYLPARACQTLLGYARLRLKIQSPIVQHRFTSPEGEFIVFEAHGTVCHRDGTEIDDVVASQSTRDEFFGGWKEWECPECHEPTVGFNQCKAHGPIKAESVTHYPPLYDVPIDDVLKKTTTNLFNRALQAIGMMPSLEDLKSGGMDISKVKRIGFKSEKPSPHQPPLSQAASPKQTPASPPPPPPPPAASPSTGPPRASVPPFQSSTPQVPLGHGKIEEVKFDKTKPKDGKGGGNEFMRIKQNGTWMQLFRNHGMDVGGRDTVPVFDILRNSVGWDCVFTVEERGQFKNIVATRKIGSHEWDEQGMPVIRRDAVPEQEAFGAQFMDEGRPLITDDDIPF